MSIEEFKTTAWGPGMRATYKGETHPIAACDFEEQLIALTGYVSNDQDELCWVRCENVTLLPMNAP